MNMNRKADKVDYIAPVCRVMDMCLSGILCTSGEKLFNNEEFEGITEYGKGGWI